MSLLANSNAIETGGYQISRSVRLRSSASAYLSRTISSNGDSRTWTYSTWVKRGLLGSSQNAFLNARLDGNNNVEIRFFSNDILEFMIFNSGSQVGNLATTQVFRDPSAWYHCVFVCDTTNATSSDRLRLYVNGVRVTAFSASTYPAQNTTTYMSQTSATHNIGRWPSGIQYLDGYLTETYFIDGQALTPSSFGETDANTGVWVAKKYTGTYGTNGFYLNFSDNSAATSTTIGKDYSGNGNNWTPNNINVSAYTGTPPNNTSYDSMLDVPSGNGYADGGNGRGNYCTLNPLDTEFTITNGNLDATQATANFYNGRSTFSVSSGKWYYEATISSLGSSSILAFGARNITTTLGTGYIGDATGDVGINSDASTFYKNNGTGNTSVSGSPTPTSGQILQCALDMDNGKVWFGVNGTWLESGNPSTATNPMFTGLSGTKSPAISVYNSSAFNLNFGQRPFSYTPPTGFKALCTSNLPAVTGAAQQPKKHFDVVTRNGTSAAANITGYQFAPDFVWIKARNIAYSNVLSNVLTGATKFMQSNTTAAEQTDVQALTAFNSDGYSLGTWVEFNETGKTYVDWAWKANGTGVSNTAGSITSTVSANTTAGFSIATTTGTGGAGTIGHGLGAIPQFIMSFRRNTAADHYCYHQAIGNTNFLVLNTTAASAASANLWNNTTPTSTVFSVGNTNNNSGDTYVHYIFAAIPGYSAFGKYTGNGSTDGPFVFCGFRPRWVLIKCFGTTSNWTVFDTLRDGYNPDNQSIYANLSAAESTADDKINILSNGFKVIASAQGVNESTYGFIYAAFAENPLKFSNAR